MPLWAYEIPPLQLALIMVVGIEAVSLIGLLLARRFLLQHLRFHDGVNDAISGTVQAIGVFYGINCWLNRRKCQEYELECGRPCFKSTL